MWVWWCLLRSCFLVVVCVDYRWLFCCIAVLIMGGLRLLGLLIVLVFHRLDYVSVLMVFVVCLTALCCITSCFVSFLDFRCYH